jgi:DMSO/TMAO reductase YedYZ molybdopterin-dependent catalytic subunit
VNGSQADANATIDAVPAAYQYQRRDFRRIGALAALVAVAGMWAVSGLIPRGTFPPAALADAVVRLTPGGVATFFIESFGHWAMRLLIIGVLAVVLALGAQVLLWTSRDGRPRPSVAGAAMAALASLLFVLPPISRGDLAGVVVSAIGGLIYAVAAGGLLATLLARSPAALHATSPARSPTSPQDTGSVPGELGKSEDLVLDASRRRVLKIGTGSALALAATGGLVGWLARRFEGPDTNVALVAPVSRAEIPARAGFPDIPGLTTEVTPVSDHYVVDINLFAPSVDAGGWKLEVFGEVEEELSLDFAQLQERFEIVEEFSVLTCISNEIGGELVGNSAWGGVRLREVLEAARVKPGGTELVLRAADGYSDSIPMELALDDSVLLAVSQNRLPLTQEHGFPCRLRIPRLYGMENVKWLESIEVVRSDYSGYWQDRGWKDTAEVRTQSRIDVAGNEGRATVGDDTWIAGIAWAGIRGIRKVEVSTDNGDSWSEAELKDPVAENSWHLWAYRWTPDRTGDAVVIVRATDGEGALQTPQPAPPHPAGATGWHSLTVAVGAPD